MTETKWTDHNNNSATIARWGSEAAALASLATLTRCKYCVDCTGCDDCVRCTVCTDCKDCKDCWDCEDCVGCKDCELCTGCETQHRKANTMTKENDGQTLIESAIHQLLSALQHQTCPGDAVRKVISYTCDVDLDATTDIELVTLRLSRMLGSLQESCDDIWNRYSEGKIDIKYSTDGATHTFGSLPASIQHHLVRRGKGA